MDYSLPSWLSPSRPQRVMAKVAGQARAKAGHREMVRIGRLGGKASNARKTPAQRVQDCARARAGRMAEDWRRAGYSSPVVAEITPNAFLLLRAISQEDGQSIRQSARSAGVSQGSIKTGVRQLVRMGYIAGEKVKARVRRRLWITQSGKELIHRLLLEIENIA